MKLAKRVLAYILCLVMTLNICSVDALATNVELPKTNTVTPPKNLNELMEDDFAISSFSLVETDVAPMDESNIDVLLIKNKDPWNSRADENVLSALGIGYVTVSIETAATMNFDEYKLIIIANDQVDGFYRQLSTIRTKLELFVMNGGTLLYGICDAGWGNGKSDLLIPGDVQLGPVTYKNYNYIEQPNHPIVSGVLTNESPLTDSMLYNNYASHRYFIKDSLPQDALVIINAGASQPTLVEYPIGNGVVYQVILSITKTISSYQLRVFRRYFMVHQHCFL